MFQLVRAAFERAVLASKSYLIALALVEGHYSVDDAAKAAHVEVQSQIDRWGEVEDSKSSCSGRVDVARESAWKC